MKAKKEKNNTESANSVQKILILPLLIALALVVGAVSARATPACGLSTVILALEHYPSGSLDLGCNEVRHPHYEIYRSFPSVWEYATQPASVEREEP